MKWIAFLSGTHPTRDSDNPWDDQVEIEAETLNGALTKLSFMRRWGGDFVTESADNLDGLIRADTLDGMTGNISGAVK